MGKAADALSAQIDLGTKTAALVKSELLCFTKIVGGRAPKPSTGQDGGLGHVGTLPAACEGVAAERRAGRDFLAASWKTRGFCSGSGSCRGALGGHARVFSPCENEGEGVWGLHRPAFLVLNFAENEQRVWMRVASCLNGHRPGEMPLRSLPSPPPVALSTRQPSGSQGMSYP